ncbi:MAG: hypothetical protein SFH39_06540 [Candidatus Magnetobacterium sp. LHC-1]
MAHSKHNFITGAHKKVMGNVWLEKAYENILWCNRLISTQFETGKPVKTFPFLKDVSLPAPAAILLQGQQFLVPPES